MIYLDNNATTPTLPEVIDVIAEISSMPLNPSSNHHMGRKARQIISQSKDTILQSVNASNADIIFTGSGTEANNLAMQLKSKESGICSAGEHSSVLLNYKQHINLQANGVVDISHLKDILNDSSKPLVSIQMVNNETGVIQPIKDITPLILKSAGYIHVDASQALGKIDINFDDLNIDMMTVSAHKIGGGTGIGALIHKKGLEFEATIKGGGQQHNYRSGTEDTARIAGFAKSCELINIDKYQQHCGNLIKHLENNLPKDYVIFGADSNRAANVSMFAGGNVSRETMVIKADINKVAISAGSACSSGKTKLSTTLQAMMVDTSIAQKAIRISVGLQNTIEDIDKLLSIIA